MRTIKTILWIQFVVGVVCGYVAFAYLHWGAMRVAWANNLRAEFDEMRRSSEYREPAKIRDQSWGKILEDFQASGRAQSRVSFYWFLSCGALTAFAAASLGLLRRTPLNPTLQTPTRVSSPTLNRW